MNCPVCQLEGITADTITCPQCGSNLGILSQIKILKSRNNKKNNLIAIAAVVIICLAAGWLVSWMLHTQPDPRQTDEAVHLAAENQALKDTLNNMAERILILQEAASSESTETAYIEHIIKEGENLWMIAQKYLGDGSLYLQIARENSIADPSVIEKGKILRIKKENQ